MTPLSNFVLIEPLEEVTRTPGGLHIPETAKERPQKGKTVAVGPGRISENGSLIPMQIQVGDTLLYGRYAGTEVTLDGKSMLLLREPDFLAKL